jgi:choline dehydrogenase-like flavoprotein
VFVLEIDMAPRFDFIIVGGGTSGSVIASRLASQTDATILVLEAGRDAGSAPDVLVPGKYVFQLDRDTDGLWNHRTTPQKHLNGRSLAWISGRQLGGTSAVNYMAMARGPAADYNEWAKLTADDGWKWQNVLPKMKAMEDFDPQTPAGYQHLARIDPSNHGVDGPIKLGFGQEMAPGVPTFVTACQEVGINICHDINSGDPVGVGLAQTNTRDGIRSYAANAYLSDEFRAQHKNLVIRTNHVVRQLVIDGHKVRGVVVSQSDSDKEIQFLCNHKVILCGGTIASPQILLSSGIGPKDDLTELGIKVVCDIPGVGNGMLDHSILTLEYRVTDAAVDHRGLFDDKALLEAAESQYRKDKTGPLSVFGTSGAVAFPKIEAMEKSSEFRALNDNTREYLSHPQRPSAEIWLASGYAAYTGHIERGQGFISHELLLQNNLSRGTVKLRQSTKGLSTEINPAYLSHPYDKRIAIETIRTALLLARTKAYSGTVVEMVHGPRDEDDESILAFVRENLGQGFHSVGTCKMGVAQDDMSVVDCNFDVQGLEGIKIADLSVCPILTCNHTQINAYLIGERCVETLIRSWLEWRETRVRTMLA